ncbi:MAG TPA: dihydrofolate reductase family protein [Chitinophagaceae bacterium]|nr:dihydrofolate reductase family protein [Chitinophagaceae bacterium]
MRKLFIYIACSVDGYIAKPNDDLSFLDVATKEGEDYGYAEFISTIDTVIVGRKTYDWVMRQIGEFPHAKDKESYIITRTPRPSEGNLHFYSGDIKELVTQLKSRPGKHIFCDGGSEIIQVLLKEDLVDEMIIFLIPVMVGAGTRLFQDGRPDQRVSLVSSKAYDTGVVKVHYKLSKR